MYVVHLKYHTHIALWYPLFHSVQIPTWTLNKNKYQLNVENYHLESDLQIWEKSLSLFEKTVNLMLMPLVIYQKKICRKRDKKNDSES